MGVERRRQRQPLWPASLIRETMLKTCNIRKALFYSSAQSVLQLVLVGCYFGFLQSLILGLGLREESVLIRWFIPIFIYIRHVRYTSVCICVEFNKTPSGIAASLENIKVCLGLTVKISSEWKKKTKTQSDLSLFRLVVWERKIMPTVKHF